MPRGDGTGPGGMGPMTGRAAGFCAGYAVPGYANPVYGAGVGYGRGFGRGGGGWGRRNMYYATGLTGWQRGAYPSPTYAPVTNVQTKEQEVDILKSQADYLSSSLEEVKKRLSELESESSSK